MIDGAGPYRAHNSLYVLTPAHFPYDSSMDKPLHIVMLEPYYGGSHACFADMFTQHSRHNVELYTLPARKWKWRMRGSAIWFTQKNKEWVEKAGRGEIDLIFCNDMMSVADLRALLPPDARRIPIVCYFHENQLTYPLSEADQRDYQYGMTNIASCLTADAVWFNSIYHRDQFLRAVDQLMGKMPDYVPVGMTQCILDKSSIHYPPVSVEYRNRKMTCLATPPAGYPKQPTGCAKILWSHRWEYDKNPEPFFHALIKLADDGFDFELVCLGEQFRTAPEVFEKVWHKLQKHIIHTGYMPSREDYLALVEQCDLVVSTAIQENFGIAMIEAVMLGCQPVLPDRLVYPEIIPDEFHSRCLYQDDHDLFSRLKNLLEGQGWLDERTVSELQQSMYKRFHCEDTIQAMDRELQQLTPQGQNTPS